MPQLTPQKQELDELARMLGKIHKSLLTYQKGLQEQEDERSYTPHEMLNLLISHPEFEWLRQISKMMVEIDIYVDSKKEPEPGKYESLITQVKNMFDERQSSDLMNRMNKAMERDASLCLFMVELKARLDKFKRGSV